MFVALKGTFLVLTLLYYAGFLAQASEDLRVPSIAGQRIWTLDGVDTLSPPLVAQQQALVGGSEATTNNLNQLAIFNLLNPSEYSTNVSLHSSGSVLSRPTVRHSND